MNPTRPPQTETTSFSTERGVELALSLATLRARIARASAAASRPPGAVTLVAVSKTYPASDIAAAHAAGQAIFGENRVQEALSKFDSLRQGRPDLRLHLIGPLQTNKVRDAVRIADVIETLDRPALVDALAREADRQGRLPDLLVQVNTGSEPQKAGILPDDAEAFITLAQSRFGTSLAGLMCIPPAGADPAPHFTALATLATRHGLGVLSMGMSADFETAIAHGATHVRVGTAIFGSRPSLGQG